MLQAHMKAVGGGDAMRPLTCRRSLYAFSVAIAIGQITSSSNQTARFLDVKRHRRTLGSGVEKLLFSRCKWTRT